MRHFVSKHNSLTYQFEDVISAFWKKVLWRHTGISDSNRYYKKNSLAK